MKVTLSPFSVVEFLDTEEMRISYLNAVLEDGDIAELKRAFRHVAEAKGVELPALEGQDWFLKALRALGLGLHSLEPSKNHTA
ncbi:helix-turn-helix domain-containing transcriptional regulator [Helicobacter bizzozeronii]|uniref:helix-turn-helix domain-containing transcriptional regulator n=1 Tax=Helicobacter bizzozeronii TaxID=56877 RepID=UPI000CEE7772|nr:hypothetical protein [Helicobacter bizzozeronii]